MTNGMPKGASSVCSVVALAQKSRVLRVFSRSCTQLTPPCTAAMTTSVRLRPAQLASSVTRYTPSTERMWSR